VFTGVDFSVGEGNSCSCCKEGGKEGDELKSSSFFRVEKEGHTLNQCLGDCFRHNLNDSGDEEHKFVIPLLVLKRLLALLASVVSVFVFYADTEEEVEVVKGGESEATFEIEERAAWTLVGSLSGAWVVVFGVFLLLMKKKYRRTFFTTRTGKQWAMDFFLKGTEDAVKKNVVGCNKNQWRAIREDVREWVQANWWRWTEEKPAWFDLAWQSLVPEEWIADVEERARLDKDKGRRRSSVEIVRGLFGAKARATVYADGVEPVAREGGEDQT